MPVDKVISVDYVCVIANPQIGRPRGIGVPHNIAAMPHWSGVGHGAKFLLDVSIDGVKLQLQMIRNPVHGRSVSLEPARLGIQHEGRKR